jgi:cytochrome c553
MHRFLLTLLFCVASLASATATATAQMVDGKPLYEEHCRECHGMRGTPPKDMQVKYETIATFNAAFIRKRSLDSLVKILTRGKGLNMKSFKGKLSKDEMTAVAAYVRELAEKTKS